ncbi:hypothetical protein NBO_1033g0001 [Nosema bombycis CQ1]|uniref:Uncharacterized protein n=2 Tax=Nosema bombycis (strain CQ1 / CVCC 102059) TaxID=578461 RepID=R0MC17_NOSB1|nr:hypothetical protein NBO_1033g0001 [Nosema bombycis CQ1]|eukprot:EOB11595.1 hypothetical protein NBO_1033g0001 [Nosema bombycis CQ1]
MVEDTTSAVLDLTTARKTFLPIIYDSETFQFINSGVFRTNDKSLKNTYASWVKLKSKVFGKIFIFVNMNLYSTKSKVDSLELANILRDLEHAGENRENLSLLMGTINSMSDEAKLTMEKSLVNLSEPKEPGVLKNTLNSYNDAVNNIQRDFILGVPSDFDKLESIYSGVLSKFDFGIRFPVHAIINVIPKKEGERLKVINQ